MSKIIKTYIPSLSIAFTFIIILATVYNIICGNTKDDFIYFIIQVVFYLIIAALVDWLIGMVNFKRYFSHLLTETIVLYPFTIGIAVWGKWFRATILNIVIYSLIYILAMITIHFYSYYISKQQADEINTILGKKRENSNG